jgi:hypothetical protein
MMKAPEKVKLAFDPTEAGIVSFTSRTAKILWCCIRKQHIVDQHFDSQVFGFAEWLDEEWPDNYEHFKDKVFRTELRKFGTNWINTHPGFSSSGSPVLDDEFWQGVWSYLQGEKELEIEVK